MKRALVLSGGGAKGSYQYGVWKALKKLNIKFDIVTGTSIGAVNGAMMTLDDFDKAGEVWEKLNTKDVFYLDYDLTTNATPEEVKKIAEGNNITEEHVMEHLGSLDRIKFDLNMKKAFLSWCCKIVTFRWWFKYY